MKNYWKTFGIIVILSIIPCVAYLLGETQFSSVKHPADKIIKTAAVQSKLHQGEKIIWSSNTDSRRAAERAVPVGILGICFILVGMKGISWAPRGLIGKLWIVFCVPFVLVGIYMLTGPYWTWRDNGDAICLLTDKRAIEIMNGMVTCDQPYSILIKPSMTKYSTDRADVLFYEDPTSSDGDTQVWEGFRGVENGNECLQILQNKLADCRKAAKWK